MVPQVVASGFVPGGHSPKISGSASSFLTSFDSLGKARVERGCAISDEEHATRMGEVCNSFVNVRERPAFHEDTRGVRMTAERRQRTVYQPISVGWQKRSHKLHFSERSTFSAQAPLPRGPTRQCEHLARTCSLSTLANEPSWKTD